MWVEDLLKGDFCKAEFFGTRLQKLHNTKKLEAVIASPFFPHAVLLEERA
jgi:hypothetical protein